MNWQDILKFNPDWYKIRAAIENALKDPEDFDNLSNDELLERVKGKGVTMEDIEKFNKQNARLEASGPVVLTSYQESLLPIIDEESKKFADEFRGAALMGSALFKRLQARKDLARPPTEDDMENIGNYLKANNKYSKYVTMPKKKTERDAYMRERNKKKGDEE